MLIPYLVKRGSFLPKFATWILEHAQELERGQTITLDLGKPGGYPAKDLRIEIVRKRLGLLRHRMGIPRLDEVPRSSAGAGNSSQRRSIVGQIPSVPQ